MATADLPKDALREAKRFAETLEVKLRAFQPLADTREATRLGKAADDMLSAATVLGKVLAAIRVAELEAQIAVLDVERVTEGAKV